MRKKNKSDIFNKIYSEYLGLILIGGVTTFISLMLVSSRQGWAILLLFLIALYIQSKKAAFLILYNLFLMRSLFFSPKLANSFSPFIFGNLLMPYSWLNKGFQMLDQLFWIFLIVVIFIETVINKRKLGRFYSKLLVLTVVLAIFLSIGSIAALSKREGFLGGIITYTKFFIAIIALPLMSNKNDNFSFIFYYTIFTISIFEIFIFLIGWLPKMLFSYANFSGDYVTLSLNTVTTAVYILGIAVIYYYFEYNSPYRFLILFLLIFIIFLGQSVAQTFLLLFIMMFAQFKWTKKQVVLKYLIYFSILIIFLILSYKFSSIYFPYMDNMLRYAERMINKFILSGITKSPKFLGLVSLLSDSSGMNFLFGNGTGSFWNEFMKNKFIYSGDIFYSMALTIYTPINKLIYEFGMIPFLVFIYIFYFIFFKIYRNNSKLKIISLCVFMYIAFSYFLFPLVDSSVVSMVAAILINGTIQHVK